jgi:acyl-CoA synthetase (AMP-forming)/AMP-acid ligase II
MPDQPTPPSVEPHRYRGKEFSDRLIPCATIPDRLADRVRVQHNDPCLTFVAGTGDALTLTYGELDRLSRRLAVWITRELDAASGTVFGLLPVADLDSAVAYVALLRAGCPVLVLNPGDPAQRVAQQTESLQPRAILAGPRVNVAEGLDAIRLPNPHSLPEPCTPWVDPLLDPDTDALYFGTSGSTAASKIVAQSHYNAAVNADAVSRHHGLRRGHRFLGCLPVHHVNGVHFSLLGTLASGAHAIIAEDFDMFQYPRLIETYRPHIASVVPSILELLAETWRRPAIPSDFRYFVSAAAALTTSTVRSVTDRFGVRVLQGYGLTETTNFSATMPRDLSESLYRRLALECDIPSIGSAFHGNEVAVLAPDGSVLPAGQQGEICMRGHNVMTRYVNNPQATEDAFADGWFHSQDLGFEIRDKDSGLSFFVVTGRTKNIAKVRGKAVSLEEMERSLCADPGVRDAACVAVADRFLGESLLALVVPRGDGAGDQELRARLAAQFDRVLLPAQFLRVAKIPRTATGKILRPELAAYVSGLPAKP